MNMYAISKSVDVKGVVNYIYFYNEKTDSVEKRSIAEVLNPSNNRKYMGMNIIKGKPKFYNGHYSLPTMGTCNIAKNIDYVLYKVVYAKSGCKYKIVNNLGATCECERKELVDLIKGGKRIAGASYKNDKLHLARFVIVDIGNNNHENKE